MKPVKIGDISVSSIIGREGPWRAPNIMFPTATPEQLAEVISLVPDFAAIHEDCVEPIVNAGQALLQGKFVLKIIVGWADSYSVCPRGLVTAWAQKPAHPTFIDFKHNYLKNKFAVGAAGRRRVCAVR